MPTPRVAPVCALLAALALPSVARADMEPSFELSGVAWRAEAVVVASEGAVIDGALTVVSSLRGPLAAGARIRLPSLALFAPDARRARCDGPFGASCEGRVSGQRMLVFLRRDARGAWVGADRHGTERVSVAWLEGGNVYALQQHMNPGPAAISLVGTEAAVTQQIAAATARRAEHARALAVADPARRAFELVALLRGTNEQADWAVNERVYDDLARIGPPAVPALRSAVGDPRLLGGRDQLVTVLGRAGGAAVASDMVAIVTAETAFWRARAPQLPVGWWNFAGPPQADVMLLRDRYSVLLMALRALVAAPSPSARASVTALRDFWRSLPQLEDRSGLNQMSETCDEVLAALSRS